MIHIVEMDYKKEVEHVLKAALLAVGALVAELDGLKSKRSGVFGEILRDS